MRAFIIPVLAGVLIAASATPLAAVETMLKDQNVARVVDRELVYDPAVPSNRIDVDIEDGIVTLEGTVSNVLAQERATRVAETVKGVRSVVNRIEVDPEPRSDQDVRGDVEAALLQDPATDSFEIDVSVADGTVTLGGAVESTTERELCATVAKGVRGVTGVTNDIRIEYDADRPDTEIQAEIQQALRWDALVDDGLIEVTVDEGNVSLRGIVGSAAERRLARHAAWTGGVHSVDDSGLRVERWARDDELRRDKYVAVSDEEIGRAIEAALGRDPRVDRSAVQVSVHEGRVTLFGIVDNLKSRRAAGQDADNTVGVIAVDNLLKVRPPIPLADRKIEKNARRMIERDPLLDDEEIRLSVRDGRAYLDGTVDTHFEKGLADDLASKAFGVVGVVNRLHVEGGLPYLDSPFVDEWRLDEDRAYDYTPVYTLKDDWEIRKDIENELWWSPFVDRGDVKIAVEDGIATLTGTVDSWMERSAARDNAYDGGATYVRNRLIVQ